MSKLISDGVRAGARKLCFAGWVAAFVTLGFWFTGWFGLPALTVSAAASGNEFWEEAGPSVSALAALGQANVSADNPVRSWRLNRVAFEEALRHAPLEQSADLSQSLSLISLPLPDGTLARFRIEASPAMEPALAARFPEIQSYRGQGVDDPTLRVRLSWSPRGLYALVLSATGAVSIAPVRRSDLPRLLYSPAPGFHLFWYGGRPMWIQRDIAMNLQVIETVKVSALFASRRLLEDMLEDVIRRAYARMADHTLLYTIDRWGESWNLAGARPRRHISSVVLDGDTSATLLADVKEFFDRRQWYADLGIPWRRGYLLHGPPGTGKTSFAYALAGELHLKLCALSLTNPKLNDQTIADLLQKTPPRSLILIEDIDAFFVARDKQDTRIEISFSGLLNALDGVAAQEGRIVFLTTNHFDRLDKALIRPGRVDVAVELGNASAAMLRTMFLRFYPDAAGAIDAVLVAYQDKSLSPARIQQALLESDDAAGAIDRLGLRAE